MRRCPVCYTQSRTKVWAMTYHVPDGWPLPSTITWYSCNQCTMLYGDGDFDQKMLEQYYRQYYGYGINSPENIMRLQQDAGWIGDNFQKGDCIIDFGGAGDDGRSIVVDELIRRGFSNADVRGPGDALPHNCDLIYASHVVEHIYDLPETMTRLVDALADDGLLIIDGPDATGLLQKWAMPILDFNTKHINHFRLLDYLRLGERYGMELVSHRRYEMQGAPAYQLHFRRYNVARLSAEHVLEATARRVGKLRAINQPVNVWGLGDVTWHLLSRVDLDVLEYIDNDPAYRGQMYKGKPVMERPTNDAPIVIMAQGQRQRLIANIRAAGVTNEIVEV